MANKVTKVLLAILALALLVILLHTLVRCEFPTPYKDAVEKYAAEYGVETKLIYAVIKAESNFDPSAVSHAGAKGLAQLTDSTAEYVAKMIGIEYSQGDSFNAEKNIRLSAYYLHYLLKKYDGDLPCTIAAYNAGEGNVDKWLKENGGIDAIPFPETEKYVKKVRIYKKIYEILYK